MKRLITAVVALSLLCGCRDMQEPNDIAYVVAVGVDKSDGGVYNFTIQFAKPVQISGGGDGGSSGGGEDITESVTIESQSLFSALGTANQLVSKRFDMSHAKLIVFSEEIAREGIGDFIGVISRSSEIRPNIYFAVSKCTAREYLDSAKPMLEINPVKYYTLIYENYTSLFSPNNLSQDFFFTESASYADSVLPLAGVLPELEDGEISDGTSGSDGGENGGNGGNSESESGGSGLSDKSESSNGTGGGSGGNGSSSVPENKGGSSAGSTNSGSQNANNLGEGSSDKSGGGTSSRNDGIGNSKNTENNSSEGSSGGSGSSNNSGSSNGSNSSDGTSDGGDSKSNKNTPTDEKSSTSGGSGGNSGGSSSDAGSGGSKSYGSGSVHDIGGIGGIAIPNYMPGELPKKTQNKSEVIGMAVFSGDKMIDTLGASDCEMYNIIKGTFTSSYIPYKLDGGKLSLTMRVQQRKKPRISVDVSGDVPRIKIRLYLEGELINIPRDCPEQDLSKDIARITALETKQAAEEFMYKTSRVCGADVCGFGGYAKRKFWTNKSFEDYNWREKFKNAEFEADVRFSMRRTGLILKSSEIIREVSDNV